MFTFGDIKRIEKDHREGIEAYITKDELTEWYAEAMIINREKDIKYLNGLPVSKENSRKVIEMQANHSFAIGVAHRYLRDK